MFDFDKDFEEYLVSYYKTHETEFENVEDMEDCLPQIYNDWANTPSAKLGNIAPIQFFQNIKSEAELIELLITTSTGELNPCSLLMDRIASESGCIEHLHQIIKGNYSTKQRMIAVNLIIENGGEHPLFEYVSWIGNDKADTELRDIAIEVLVQNADTVKEQIYKIIEQGCDLSTQLLCAEILVNAGRDERTFVVLEALLKLKKELAVVAGFVGKYGDERHAQALYRALEGADYLQFIELKNAIERLGGIVDESDFDFDGDMYYKALKGIN